MAISRILAVTVIGALLLMAGLTLYNAVKTTSVAADISNGYHEQRADEWIAGNAPYAGRKLDQHERLAPSGYDAWYAQRQSEWNAGENYADGKLDQHERGEWFIK